MITQAGPHFNWVDYAIISVICVSVLISFFRGFISEAISLIAWILGLFLALSFSTSLQHYFEASISSQTIRYFVSFVCIFLAVVILGLLLNLVVGLIIKSTGLSLLDRLAGVIFGVLRGVAVVAVLLLMFTNLGTMKESLTLSHSVLAKRFKPTVLWLDGFLPEKMRTMAEWVFHDFKNFSANSNQTN